MRIRSRYDCDAFLLLGTCRASIRLASSILTPCNLYFIIVCNLFNIIIAQFEYLAALKQVSELLTRHIRARNAIQVLGL